MGAGTNYRRIVLFLILIIQGGHGLYLCGPAMIQYDPKTHNCTDDVVQPISSVTERELTQRIACYDVKSDTVELIDPNKFECKNSTILKKTTPTPAKTTSTTMVAQPTASSDSDTARTLAACRSYQKNGLPTGFDCCDDLAYRPEDQTCCYQSGSREVFNVSQHDHVCCNELVGFSVHPRGSIDLPCQHSSTNDQFFTKLRHFNPSKIPDADFHRFCEETKNVFRVTVEKLRKTKDEPQFVAMLTAWTFSPYDKKSIMSRLPSPYENERIKISLDQYSPTQNKLQRKPFLVLTNFNYFSQAVFFLKPDDHLYKFPKHTERLNKALKKLGKKCRKSRRKSRRGS